MSHEMDLSSLDRKEVLEVIFPVVYSPFIQNDYFTSSSSNTKVYSTEVEKGINVNSGFWVSSKESPSILYFHGNGETVNGHDWIAPLYNQHNINLFVADYRGYGSSNGKPTVANMLTDAHFIFRNFQEITRKEGFNNRIFLMGRSLGSLPAIELGFHYQDEICGLIIESGSANNLHRLLEYFNNADMQLLLSEDSLFLNKVKIRQVQKPTLIIHGEYDQTLPVTEGQELYHNSGAEDKQLLIIPGADHNSIMSVALDLYFDTIEKFIKSHN
ncbi:alpha/beta hydrolase [Chloroflexota bacterium]